MEDSCFSCNGGKLLCDFSTEPSRINDTTEIRSNDELIQLLFCIASVKQLVGALIVETLAVFDVECKAICVAHCLLFVIILCYVDGLDVIIVCIVNYSDRIREASIFTEDQSISDNCSSLTSPDGSFCSRITAWKAILFVVGVNGVAARPVIPRGKNEGL